MEITGKIYQVLALQSGQGKNGIWKKQEYVIETDGQYPKKICFVLWGDAIDQYKITQGDMVTASIDIESREFNGKWYTDVKAWKVAKESGQPSSDQNGGIPLPPAPPEGPEDSSADFPF